MKALTADMTTDAKVTEAPRQPSATGYGDKLPTPYMLRIENRWHRVYVVNYGNAGSSYVLIRGQKHFLSTSAEMVLETVRDGGTHAEALAKMMEWPEWMRTSEKQEGAATQD